MLCYYSKCCGYDSNFKTEPQQWNKKAVFQTWIKNNQSEEKTIEIFSDFILQARNTSIMGCIIRDIFKIEHNISY